MTDSDEPAGSGVVLDLAAEGGIGFGRILGLDPDPGSGTVTDSDNPAGSGLVLTGLGATGGGGPSGGFVYHESVHFTGGSFGAVTAGTTLLIDTQSAPSDLPLSYLAVLYAGIGVEGSVAGSISAELALFVSGVKMTGPGPLAISGFEERAFSILLPTIGAGGGIMFDETSGIVAGDTLELRYDNNISGAQNVNHVYTSTPIRVEFFSAV